MRTYNAQKQIGENDGSEKGECYVDVVPDGGIFIRYL